MTTVHADNHGNHHAVTPAAQNIVEIAAANGDFKTLTAAVTAAGLADTLQGDGPFTVFAPNDAAFAALPAGTLDSLLKPENKDQLVAILTYHVVPGAVMAKDVVGLSEATTVHGNALAVSATDGAVTVDGARVLATDIKASNGVIHVIDRVMLPKS
ncbi:MAG: fasciclin domain-containing protein [Proteobacteria bacterium]|nr:fasciclin domain-containing protein [Pseudomonadota bacterium]